MKTFDKIKSEYHKMHNDTRKVFRQFKRELFGSYNSTIEWFNDCRTISTNFREWIKPLIYFFKFVGIFAMAFIDTFRMFILIAAFTFWMCAALAIYILIPIYYPFENLIKKCPKVVNLKKLFVK